MKTIGFISSKKENEFRRAIVPNDLLSVKNIEKVFIEHNYGEALGISDDEFEKLGCNIVSRDDILKKDIICDPKIGDADYLDLLDNQTIFG